MPVPVVFDATPHLNEPETRSSADESTAAAPANQPRWWHEALALEAANQLDGAEKHIRDNCHYINYAYSTAEMYRLRRLRMKQAGDLTGALAAFKQSGKFILHYASLATSGGEGAARASERDQFRAQLVADYGTDPEATR